MLKLLPGHLQRLGAGVNPLFELGVSDGVQQLSVDRTRRNTQPLQIIPADQRRRVELFDTAVNLLLAPLCLGAVGLYGMVAHLARRLAG